MEASAVPREGRRTAGGWIWFGLMVAGWAAFYVTLFVSEPALGEVWTELRAQPLLVEGLVWLLVFPFTLALAIWEGSWSELMRFAIVVLISLAWSAMFFPRKTIDHSGG